MFKRGQLTNFIIVGIVIVALALLFVYFGGFKEPGLKQLNLERFAPIESFIQECLDDTLKSVVINNMKQGGYSVVYGDGVDIGDAVVPYYLVDGVVLVPEKDDIEKELSLGMNKIDSCLDFSDFKEFDIKTEENTFSVSIMQNAVIVNANIPIKASFNNITRNFDGFKSVLNMDLNNLLDASKEYMEIQKNDLNATFVGGLSDIAYERDLGFNIISLDEENAVIYSFSDGKIDDEEVVLMFAIEK